MFRQQGAIFREIIKNTYFSVSGAVRDVVMILCFFYKLPEDCTLVPKHVAVGT